MNTMITKMMDAIKGILIDFIGNNLQGMVADVNSQAMTMGNELAISPLAWNPSIWAMIQSLATTVIVPIAGIILTYVMCLELIGWINDTNNLHSGADVINKLIKFIFKLGIGVLLVQKALTITMGIFELGSYAVTKSMGVVGVNSGQVSVSIASIKLALQNQDIGGLMNLAFVTTIGGIGMMVVGVVINLIITGRMIEIYIYCACGSAPYATLTNKETSSIGQNYIKNLLALAFQGFFMFVMLGIYVVLMQSTVNNIMSSNDPKGLVIEIMLISATLCMMLLRSKSIAKSIFSAH